MNAQQIAQVEATRAMILAHPPSDAAGCAALERLIKACQEVYAEKCPIAES
jgi:hypothetical protein